jgi:hypothetical protein
MGGHRDKPTGIRSRVGTGVGVSTVLAAACWDP